MSGYTPPTPAELQAFVDACDTDTLREAHKQAQQAVNGLKGQMSELTTAQHELERQAIAIKHELDNKLAPIKEQEVILKEAKNKLAVMIREHILNAGGVKDYMFASIERRKQTPR